MSSLALTRLTLYTYIKCVLFMEFVYLKKTKSKKVIE